MSPDRFVGAGAVLVECFFPVGGKDGAAVDYAVQLMGARELVEQNWEKEIPEDFWFYRLLKKNVFFGMGAIS